MQRIVLLLICFIQTKITFSQFFNYEPHTFQEDFLLHNTPFNSNIRFSERFYFIHDSLIPIQVQQKEKRPTPFCSPFFKNRNHWILEDNPELGHVNTTKKRIYNFQSQFFSYQSGKSSIAVNPILHFHFGPNYMNFFQQNGRGIELRGRIENKVSFYSQVIENQTFFPSHLQEYRDSYGVVPQLGWWKKFKDSGTDYLIARGYFNTTLIGNSMSNNYLIWSAGHNNFFIGNGYRSLILSNSSTPYLFSRFLSQIGIFRYQNLFAQLHGFTPLLGNTLLPKKYMAMHRAELFIGKKIKHSIGLTETTIHSRNNGSGGFDLEYLNPIIFYRSIEANNGSADNIMMALDYKLAGNNFSLYGQFLLDEFKLKYIRQGNWWGNKYGIQLGGNVKIVLKKHSYLQQLEYNTVRPYTYSHFNPLNAYSHYNQALAHPLGSNFNEWIYRLNIMPVQDPYYCFQIILQSAQQGIDSFLAGTNYGSDIRKTSNTRVGDNHIKQLQGARIKLFQIHTEFAYMVYHNYWLFIQYQSRNLKGYRNSGNHYFGFGLRVNFQQNPILF